MKKVTLALLAAAALLAGCDQFVARTWGGNITHKLPEGAQLISMSWKEANLWVLYYKPLTKSCIFAESSANGVLEGSVTVPNCNPLALTSAQLQGAAQEPAKQP